MSYCHLFLPARVCLDGADFGEMTRAGCAIDVERDKSVETHRSFGGSAD
jgi:hypothetical protein